MQLSLSFTQQTLNLPKRYEILEQKVAEKGAEITKIVRKIDSANDHVKELLGKIHVGGIGQFQMFLGESGSGKTTFLRTISNFFKDIDITTFSKLSTYINILETIENKSHIKQKKIFIIDEKDNPSINPEELRTFFENLRILFRKPEGAVLLIWPITDVDAAQKIADIAWKVGQESICPIEGAIYNFNGLPKNEYFDVADETIRALNNGERLDSFGVSKQASDSLLTDSKTIGGFYSRIEQLSYQINQSSWEILEEKVKPKIWILLPGDSASELDRTVKSLTQGIENRIDVDRMLAYLDDVTNTSAYLNEWRKRRDHAGFLFRFLDVRLFQVSPNLALSAIRVHGTKEAKQPLNKKSEGPKICNDLVRRSNFYTSLTDQTDSSKRAEKGTKQETQQEFLRLQQNSKTQDKGLNKAFAKAIETALLEDGYSGFFIKGEKQELTGTNLKPDIIIQLGSNEVICLELTWRSTGIGIDGEIQPKQNTMTPGHIQKYILDKVMEYVKELDL